MSDYKVRLEQECSDLQVKVEKLFAFIGSEQFDTLSDDNKHLLRVQYQYMRNYFNILCLRTAKCNTTENLPRQKIDYKVIQHLLSLLTFEFYRVPGTNTTTCTAVLNNFTIASGEAGCLNEADFSVALGEQYSKERCLINAENFLWTAEGYARHVYYTI
jgi:hypothetical protein